MFGRFQKLLVHFNSSAASDLIVSWLSEWRKLNFLPTLLHSTSFRLVGNGMDISPESQPFSSLYIFFARDIAHLWLSSSSFVWTAGGESWQLEETASCTSHPNNRTLSWLASNSILFQCRFLIIVRHFGRVDISSGTYTTGFLHKTDMISWLCSGNSKFCRFADQLPYKG